MNIPKKLHHIWVGDKYVPPIDWMNTWRQHHPDWEYTLWTDSNLKDKVFYNQHLIDEYYRREIYSGVSDLIRYELLYEYGGFIPPSDSICLNNTNELFWNANIFGVYENEKIRSGYISPIYASIPKHPLLKIILEELHLKDPKKLGDPWDETGNVFLYYLLKQYTFSDLLIFPSHYFIPEHFDHSERYDGNDKIYAKQMWGSTLQLYKPIHKSKKQLPKKLKTDKVSFIIPYATKQLNKKINLYEDWFYSNETNILQLTLNCIQNINNTITIDKEIILVDNTNTFPNFILENTKIVKGFQYQPTELLIEKFPNINFDNQNFQSDALWNAMAYNVGLEYVTGDYVVLQHNDIFYHTDVVSKLLPKLKQYEYICIDNKKISIQAYFAEKELFDNKINNIMFSPFNGSFIKTEMGLSDAYFFFASKQFFEDYYVDWKYGDVNHGATIKCLNQNKKYLHIGPYYDNPNFETDDTRIYYYENEKFISHLKGGFSEHKLSSDYYNEEVDLFLKKFNNDL